MNRDCRSNSARLMLATGALILSVMGSAAQAESVKPVDDLAQADARLASIGYRLAEASANRCERPEMMTGLSFHDIAGYDADARALVLKAHGLTQGFGIQAALPEGAGARSGLRRGDEIVAVNGTDMQSFGTALITRRASYRRVEAFLALLDTALRAGPATVTIRRDGQTQDLTLTGDAGCGGQFTVQPGRAFNAWSDGHYVAVTTRMMASIPDDDELAFVVAHEMAHNILRHSEILAGKSGFFAELGIGSAKVKATEIAADQLAVRLIASAGFDRAAPERFLRHSASFRFGDLAISHPGLNTRIRLVDAELASLAPQTVPVPGNAPALAPGWVRIGQAVLTRWALDTLPASLAGFVAPNGATPAVLPGIVVKASFAAGPGERAATSQGADPWRISLASLNLGVRSEVATTRCEPAAPALLVALDAGAFRTGEGALSLSAPAWATAIPIAVDLAAISRGNAAASVGQALAHS